MTQHALPFYTMSASLHRQFLENILCECETGWFYPDLDSFEEITVSEAVYRLQLRTPKPEENPSFVQFLNSTSFIITDEGEPNCFRVTDGNIDMFVSSILCCGVFGIDLISERAGDTEKQGRY